MRLRRNIIGRCGAGLVLVGLLAVAIGCTPNGAPCDDPCDYEPTPAAITGGTGHWIMFAGGCDGPQKNTAEARAVGWGGSYEDLADRFRSTVRRHPSLVAPAMAVASSWSAVDLISDGDDTRSATVTRRMLFDLSRCAEAVRSVADDPVVVEAASRVETAIRSEPFIGASIDRVVAKLLEVAAPKAFVDDAAIRLSDRERGLARQGEVLLIPASAHAGGAQGTRWRTDLVLTAVGGVTTRVAIGLLPRNQANLEIDEETIEIAGGRVTVLEDVLDTLFDFNGAAALRLTCETGAVVATSRTYNLEGQLGDPDARTFGQFLPAMSADDAVVFGDEGRLLLLAHDPTLEQGQRTNVILVNGGDEDVHVDIDLFGSDGVEIGDVEETLQPWEYRQFDGIFEDVTSAVVDDGYAVVEVETPGGRVYALASVVDNLTGDPVAVPTVLRSPFGEQTLHETQVIQAAAKTKGVGDTDWRTDLVLHALTGDTPTAFSILASVELLPRGQENTSPEIQQVSIPLGQTVRFDDVLESLFETDGAASIRVTSYGGVASVDSRTYNLLGEGNAGGYPSGATFGQYLGPIGFTESVLFGDRAVIPHLSHDPSLISGSRANLGLVNNSFRQIDVEIDLYDGDGTRLGSITKTLRTWENVQIGKVFEHVTDEPVNGGYAVLQTTHQAGAFVAHGSVIDNRTGDPITIDAIVIRRAEPAGLVATGDMLMQLFETGFDPATLFGLLSGGDLADTMDAMAAAMPDRVVRTDDGVLYDLGVGSSVGETLFASGQVAFEDLSVTDGVTVSGTVRLDFSDAAVDGRSPVVDDLVLGLDLNQVAGDGVAGTVTLASNTLTKSATDFGGSLQFDSRICERYPIGGSITVTIGGEVRTITFDDSCDGSFGIDIPSASFYALGMEMNDCDESPSGANEIHLVDEDGQLSVDPSSPAQTSGRARFVATGRIGSTDASVLFGQKGGSDGQRRLGSFRGTQGQGGYWAGIYGYTVSEGDCTSSFHHGRDDPGFSPGILAACSGPCWQ